MRDSTPVRWNPTLAEFEMRCDDCRRRSVASYWPITTEFWIPGRMVRCRACHEVKQRLDKRIRRTDAEKRAIDVQRVRDWRRRNRERHRQNQAAYRATHLERVREIDRQSYHRRKAQRQAAA
jgi:hypothetical protein